MKKSVLVGVIAIAGLVGLSACAGNPAPGHNKAGPRVAFIVAASTDFVTAEKKGITEAIADSGGSVEVFNGNFDDQTIQQQCRDAVSSQRFDAFVLEVTPASGTVCANIAAEAKIPAFQLDLAIGPDPIELKPQVDGVVGSVLYDARRNADGTVELVKAACKGINPCKIAAELASDPDPLFGLAIQRVQKEVPGAKIVQTFVGAFDPTVIQKTMPDVLTAHPDLNVFLATADSQALAAVPAVQSAGLQSQVKIIGNGGSKLGAKAVADGVLFGSLANYPERAGAAIGKMALQAFRGDKVAPSVIDGFTLGKVFVITKSNVANFTPEWGTE